MRLLKKRSQFSIEYSVTAALVILGILGASPYVFRSVNAFFVFLENQNEDSIKDPGFHAHLNVLQADPPGCDCTEWYPTSHCNQDCAFNERIWERKCFPLGCNTNLKECRYDDTCCTDWEDSAADDGYPPPYPVCDVRAVPNGTGPGGVCPFEEKLQDRYCWEAGVKEWQCIYDAVCDYKCDPDVYDEHFGIWCPGAKNYVPYPDYPSSWIDEGTCPEEPPAGDPVCKIECQLPFEPKPPPPEIPTKCDCPKDLVERPTGSKQCLCNHESVYYIGCPQKYIRVDGCDWAGAYEVRTGID